MNARLETAPPVRSLRWIRLRRWANLYRERLNALSSRETLPPDFSARLSAVNTLLSVCDAADTRMVRVSPVWDAMLWQTASLGARLLMTPARTSV